MIDPAHSSSLSLDNYRDLLALAGLARATGTCSACPATAPALRTEALWMLRDRSCHDLSSLSLLCSRHAAQWHRAGHLTR